MYAGEELSAELLKFAEEQMQAAQALAMGEGASPMHDDSTAGPSPGTASTKGDEAEKENDADNGEDEEAALKRQQRQVLDAKLAQGVLTVEEHKKMVRISPPPPSLSPESVIVTPSVTQSLPSLPRSWHWTLTTASPSPSLPRPNREETQRSHSRTSHV